MIFLCFCSGLTLALLLSLTIVGQALTPTTYFTPADRERFRRIFQTAAADSLESVYYAVLGSSLLGDVPSEPQVCLPHSTKFLCIFTTNILFQQ